MSAKGVSPVEYRLLGPIEVEDNGTVVAAGGPRLRRLLAMLVVHADSVVSVDQLIEAVWGDDLPAAAEATLQTYVSRLRHALDDGDASGSRIVSRPPGYVLVSNGDAIDARRFETSLATAREAMADGDDQRATAVLGDSLGWWRGAALAEFSDEPWAHAEALGLDELRVVGLEEFAVARLASGHPEVVIGDLERLVAARPLAPGR